MFFYKFYHIIFIFIKKIKSNFVKKIFLGTNSKNCFLKKKYNNNFYTIIKNNFLKINNVKIFQNNLKIPLTRLILHFKNIIFFKKIIGFMVFFNINKFLSKISFIISKIKKKKIFQYNKKIFFFIFIEKNFLSKKLFFKNKNFTSKIFSHNDLFKDNILIIGNYISSLIDFNNFSFFKNNNDLINIILEFSINYNYKKFFLIENFFKNKKNIIYFLNEYILKIFFLRKKKTILKKKIKNSIFYLKKYFFYENF